MSRSPEVMLLSGGALLVLLGNVATAQFSVRFLEPVIPLLVVGGLAGALDLYAFVRYAPADRHRAASSL